MDKLDSTIKELENSKRTTDKRIDYWRAREVQMILAYSDWRNFENAINRACMACESAGFDQSIHFVETTKMIQIGKGGMVNQKDYFLTRYACYLITMNSDTSKPEIGTAQAYFAIQTRKQELQEKLTADQRRILLRNRIKDANRSLASTAKRVGVQKYPIFQDAGYQGLYGMGLRDIKRYKGIKDDLLDRAGRTELAANEFRITQTEDKLSRDNINGEQEAIDTHRSVSKAVRNTIRELGGIMPENLPPETSIKKLERKCRKEIKEMTRKRIPN
jgi:DNA-damage-inducible protein D